MPIQSRLILAAVLVAAHGASFAFDSQGRARIAIDAIRLAPPALARQINRNRDALLKGARQVTPPRTPAEAQQWIAAEADRAVAMIDTHRPFLEISGVLGRLAGALTCLNNPLWGEASEPDRTDAQRFSVYFEDHMDRFPLVHARGGPPATDRQGLAGLAAAIRLRYEDDRQRLRLAYHPPDGGSIQPADFDERSVPFAIASLAYSNAVNDVAIVWIDIWRRANGDLTGTPFLAASPGEKHP